MNEIIIKDQAELDCLAQQLLGETRIAMDTEFMRVRTYYPKLCLIQLKSENIEVCIDPFKVESLNCLAALFGSGIPIILHASRQDYEVLQLHISQNIVGLRDTQLAAAFCGFGDCVSYAAMVERMSGVVLDKAHTRTNWAARPLSSDQIAYAVEDVRYLLDLDTFLQQELVKLQRWEWYLEECRGLAKMSEFKIDPLNAWNKLKGIGKIPNKHKPVAKKLCAWREEIAQRRDLPREWVLSSAAIIALSIQPPMNLSEFSRIDTMSSGMIKTMGPTILSKIFEVEEERKKRSTREAADEKTKPLTNKQKNKIKDISAYINRFSQIIGLSRTLLANRNDIEALVTGEQDVSLLRGWRKAVLGDEIVEKFL